MYRRICITLVRLRGLCFTRDVFSPTFSDVPRPRPITVKLCHIMENWLNFIMQVHKFGDALQKNWGQKHAKISIDFIQPPTLIANISK